MSKIKVEKDIYKMAISRSDKNEEELHEKYPLKKWMEGEEEPDLDELEEFSKDTRTPLGCLLLYAPIDVEEYFEFVRPRKPRNIMFRGKTNTLEWVYGKVTNDSNYIYGHTDEGMKAGDEAEKFEIIPRTVCQLICVRVFPELSPIYEGDILLNNAQEYRGEIGVPFYHSYSLRIHRVKTQKNKKIEHEYKWLADGYGIDIIGNVFDSPHLAFDNIETYREEMRWLIEGSIF